MDRSEVVRCLEAREAELRSLGLARLSLFGSTARGEARPGSDVDLAASFDPAARVDMFDFAAIEARLREMVGAPVDLVGEPARSPRCRRRSTGTGFVYSEHGWCRLRDIVDAVAEIEP